MSPVSSIPSASPAIGVIFNPRSHGNRSVLDAAEAMPNVIVASPAKRGELGPVLAGFADRGVECIAISGGDGTVRDVLTAGMPVFGENWPALAVIPAGKTNALNIDLGAPKAWTLAGVIDALGDGRRVTRRPLRVRDTSGGGELVGFMFGAGMFTVAVGAGQDAHRLGAFNGVAVAVTTGWSVIQGVLGSDSNIFRRGAPMRIRIGADATDLPYVGTGDPARRAILLAATLERFPFGMRPFGAREGLKLAVSDGARRRVLATIPAIAFGWESDWLARNGVHVLSTERVLLDLGDRFILDGEAFPAGSYELTLGPQLSFVVP